MFYDHHLRQKESPTFKSGHILVQFYTLIVKSILSPSIKVRLGSCFLLFKGHGSRMYSPLLSGSLTVSFFLSRSFRTSIADKKTVKIATDLAHPANHLFEKHSTGRQYRSINTMITHHLNSFFPKRCHLTQPLPRISDAKTYYASPQSQDSSSSNIDD